MSTDSHHKNKEIDLVTRLLSDWEVSCKFCQTLRKFDFFKLLTPASFIKVTEAAVAATDPPPPSVLCPTGASFTLFAGDC